jgi:hypothetical protein
MIDIGSKAPDFALKDQNGKTASTPLQAGQKRPTLTDCLLYPFGPPSPMIAWSRNKAKKLLSSQALKQKQVEPLTWFIDLQLALNNLEH